MQMHNPFCVTGEQGASADFSKEKKMGSHGVDGATEIKRR
jgi:hypothetical protein